MSTPGAHTVTAPVDARWTATKQALLLAIRAESGRDPRLVRLRDGTGDPLILVHPANGTVHAYRDLTGGMTGNLAVTGVVCDPADLGRVHDLTGLAQLYVAMLGGAGIRPAGVAGWSTGGLLAYEMARHLDTLVVLLDAMPTPAGTQDHADDAALLIEFVEDLLRGRGGRAASWTHRALRGDGTAEDRLRRVMALDPDLRALAADAPGLAEELVRRFTTFAALARLSDRYTPVPSQVPVTLIRPAASPVTPAMWAAARVVRDIVVPGDHYSLLRPPTSVAVLGAVLEALTGAGVSD